MLWPKKNSYKEFDNKKNSCGSKIPEVEVASIGYSSQFQSQHSLPVCVEHQIRVMAGWKTKLFRHTYLALHACLACPKT